MKDKRYLGTVLLARGQGWAVAVGSRGGGLDQAAQQPALAAAGGADHQALEAGQW